MSNGLAYAPLNLDFSIPQAPASQGNSSQPNSRWKHLQDPSATCNKEDEKWLERQFDLIDTAYSSVSLGPEMLQNMVMFSFGSPWSRKCLMSYLLAMAERAKKICKSQHVDVDSANDGFMIGLMLLLTKIETCKTGLDQFLFCFGESDHAIWATKYKPVLMTQHLKQLHLLESLLELVSVENDEMRLEVDRMFRLVTDLIQDPILYGLMVLVAVTTPMNWDPNVKPLAELNSRYHMLLQRRVYNRVPIKSGQGLSDPNEVLGKIYDSFSYLKRLSDLFKPLVT